MARLGTHGGSGDEGRIRAHFKGSMRHFDADTMNMSQVYMGLARRWKRPIAEIRRIVGKPRSET